MSAHPFTLLLIIIVAPILTGVLNKFLPMTRWQAACLSIGCLLVSLAACALSFTFPDGAYAIAWYSVGATEIGFSLYADVLSKTFALLVVFISLLTHIYSFRYMAKDARIRSYLGELSFFTGSMAGVALSGNLLLLFCFWELIGYSSYRLIGHWFEREKVGRAATQAFIVNRVADLGFIVGLMMLWHDYGHVDLGILLAGGKALPVSAMACIMIGALGKSAQLPFSAWLPAAMVGPTPVSALLHSATLVAAGAFMLLRLYLIFPLVLGDALIVIGGLTCLWSGWQALRAFDIKIILAFSTISQLGFIFVGLGCGGYQAALHHTAAHAFFKAGLFLWAGQLIGAAHQAGEDGDAAQDIRRMRGVGKLSMLSYVGGIICLSSLAGLPPTSGFFSKEELLLAMVTHKHSGLGVLPVIFFFAALIVTGLYCGRLGKYIVFGQSKAKQTTSLWISLPVVVLGGISLILGFYLMTLQELHGVAIVSSALVCLSLISGYQLDKYDIQRRLTGGVEGRLDTFYQRRIAEPFWRISKGVQSMDKIIDVVLHFLVYAQVSFAKVIGWADKHIVDRLIVVGNGRFIAAVGLLYRRTLPGNIQIHFIGSLIIFIVFLLYLLIWQ